MELDAFVVMPNHVHGIAVFVGAGLALPEENGAASSAPTLGDVVRAFKSLSAIHVNRLLRRSGPLWQRNYYEHVIRNERELDKIREYIATNPLRWALDRENPQLSRVALNSDTLAVANARQLRRQSQTLIAFRLFGAHPAESLGRSTFAHPTDQSALG
jgi:REP element-mobilizing transposase RayT